MISYRLNVQCGKMDNSMTENRPTEHWLILHTLRIPDVWSLTRFYHKKESKVKKYRI